MRVDRGRVFGVWARRNPEFDRRRGDRSSYRPRAKVGDSWRVGVLVNWLNNFEGGLAV